MTARTPQITVTMVGAALGLAGGGGSSTGAAGSTRALPAAPSAGMGPSAMPSSPVPSTMASSSMAPAKATITIQDYKYKTPASVGPGAPITVTNDDSVNHTVTAKDKSLVDVPAKSHSSTTFTAPSRPGTYPFGCTFPAEMHGVLVVK